MTLLRYPLHAEWLLITMAMTMQARITALKERREKQVEKERYAKLAEKMHVKRVERLKRREKRNKALKER